MLGPIIGGIIGLVIASLFAALILQLASRVVYRQVVDYGEAFRTSLIALVITRVATLGLEAAGLDQWFVSPALALLVWTVLISALIGLDLMRSFAIAVLMLLITIALIWISGLVLGLLFESR